MKYHSGFSVAIVALALTTSRLPQRAEAGWKPCRGLLMTKWSEDVSPDKVWPEYPRPQMTRNRWMNLNGLWDYRVTAKDSLGIPVKFDGQILVPFCIEAPLSGVMKPLLPDQRLWYAREFTIPRDWEGQNVLLHFGAVDWETIVFLDGRKLGAHRGGYDNFTFDITKHVKAGETHKIAVSVWDPTDGEGVLHGKQSLHPGGCSFTACSGIWQTVWLEPVPESSIAELKAVPDLGKGILKLTVIARIRPHPLKVEAVVSDGVKVATVSGDIGDELQPEIRANLVDFIKATSATVSTELEIPIPNPKAWSPESPFLYDLTVRLKDADGTELDSVGSYFGMRSLKIGHDTDGNTRLLLNGQPILMPGALDQSYWPDGVYLAPTDEALRFDIEWAKKLGLNSLRMHVKVEPDRWYYWADKLGIMVFQDLPTGNCGDPRTDTEASPMAADQWRAETMHIVQDKFNHPSIVCWDLFNEMFGGFDYVRNAGWVKDMDPGRLVNESSGFPFHGKGDVADGHGGIRFKDPNRITIVSEAGTASMGCRGHEWPHPWTYGSYDPKTGKEIDFLATYNVDKEKAVLPDLTPEGKVWLTNKVGDFFGRFLRESPKTGLSGLFYCHLMDVETECEGLISYDREVPKIDPVKVAEVIRTSTPKLTPATASRPNPLPFTYTEGQTAPRTEVRDPCIIREDGTYYLVFTMWPFRNREEKFLREPNQGGSPGIALYSSRDLRSWKFENWLVKSAELPENCPYKNRFWAPEIHKIAGNFYLIFTADNWLKNEYNPAGAWGTAGYAFVGVADKITGPYEHITWICGAGCDTTLFGDTDGKTYAFIPRGNIDVQEIDLTGIARGEVKLLGNPRRIVTADNGDIGVAAKPEYLEGPWVEKIGAVYCLFYAEIYRDPKFPDWLGYWTGLAIADTPLGPWKKDARGKTFLGGHLAVFDGPDHRKWFSYRGESPGAANGRLCVTPVNIDCSARRLTTHANGS
jgi:hypothetical protein